ncbi:MAG: hypothetical protein AB1393_07025 [Candidatus Edwardsbacteria bacterium]
MWESLSGLDNNRGQKPTPTSRGQKSAPTKIPWTEVTEIIALCQGKLQRVSDPMGNGNYKADRKNKLRSL